MFAITLIDKNNRLILFWSMVNLCQVMGFLSTLDPLITDIYPILLMRINEVHIPTLLCHKVSTNTIANIFLAYKIHQDSS